MGNPPLPGLRLSGGDIWLDVVMKNYTRAGTVAYDFAVGANAVNSSRVQDSNPPPSPIGDLRGQLAGFESSIGAAGSGKVKWTSTNTLFVNWFGINDVAIQVYQGRDRATAQAILGPDVTDYFGRMERQWQLGARNFVTVLVPRKSCITHLGGGRPLTLMFDSNLEGRSFRVRKRNQCP